MPSASARAVHKVHLHTHLRVIYAARGNRSLHNICGLLWFSLSIKVTSVVGNIFPQAFLRPTSIWRNRWTSAFFPAFAFERPHAASRQFRENGTLGRYQQCRWMTFKQGRRSPECGVRLGTVDLSNGPGAIPACDPVWCFRARPAFGRTPKTG